MEYFIIRYGNKNPQNRDSTNTLGIGVKKRERIKIYCHLNDTAPDLYCIRLVDFYRRK